MDKATPFVVADDDALPYLLALGRRRRRVLRRKAPHRRLFHKSTYLSVFHAAPNAYQLLSPDLVIVDANTAYCAMTGTRRENIIGRKAFQVFPEKDNPSNGEGRRKICQSFHNVLRTGRPDRMKRLRYDLRRDDGNYEEHYWMIENLPVFDETRRVALIINHPEDVTAMVKMLELDEAAAEVGGLDGEIKILHQQLATLRGLLESSTTPSLRAALIQLTDEIEAQCERLIGERVQRRL
jgi:PAS domain S-box-containing protein